MSDDLDRAVDARIASYRPDALPPFSAIEARKRSRDRRRTAVGASALSVVALAGVSFVVPVLTGNGDRLTPGVASAGTQADALARQCAAGPFRDRTQDYRGLTEQEAQRNAGAEGGYTSVLARDGLCQSVLTNLDTRRVSLVINDGKVTWAGQEGAPAGAAAGQPAFWEIDPNRPPRPEDRAFGALVSRLGCASGETGEVMPPRVVEDQDEVVVTFTVAPPSSGVGFCTVNKPVPYAVVLSRPLGGRTLRDGTCDRPPARTTSACLTKQRWPSD